MNNRSGDKWQTDLLVWDPAVMVDGGKQSGSRVSEVRK